MNSMKELDITEGLATSVWSSLNKALNSNSPETVNSFVTFFRTVIRSSVQLKKFDTYKEFINFPVWLYINISVRERNGINNNPQFNQILELMSLHLKEIVMMLDYGRKYSEEKPLPSNFYYQGFSAFNNLLYQQVKFQDWNLLESSIRRYNQLDGSLFNSSANKIFQLRRNIEKNKTGNDTKLSELKQALAYHLEINRYRRQALTALKYWLYFLYDKSVLSEEHLNILINVLNKGLVGEDENNVDDILFFRTENLRSYMGWENWDYIERPESEIYSPPIAADWLTFGFTIDRLRTRDRSFRIENIGSKLRNAVPYLYEDVKETISLIRNDFEKWQKILRYDRVKDFQEVAENLLRSISHAMRNVISEKERIIAAIPLDPIKVFHFTEELATVYKEQTRIRRIFDYFGNKENVTGQDIHLKRVGTRNFLEKGKINFIDGQFHMPIYGLQDIGATVARWENNLFLDVIGKSVPQLVYGKSMIKVLDKAFETLKKSNVVPTAIILEPEYIYKDDELNDSGRYTKTYKAEYNPDNINFLLIGEFDGIPMFTCYSPDLKDRVIVSDFSEAFLMRYKTDRAWIQNELSVSVEEINEEAANKKFNEDPEKWLRYNDEQYISEDDAKIIIKNSVIIDAETIMDYEVKDKTKFVVGIITEPPLD